MVVTGHRAPDWANEASLGSDALIVGMRQCKNTGGTGHVDGGIAKSSVC